MKIAVMTHVFPALSETFILNQITGLLERGHEVWILAERQGRDTKVHPEVDKHSLQQRTFFPPPSPSSKGLCWLRALGLLLRNLPRYPSAMLRFLGLFLLRRRGLSLNVLYYLLELCEKQVEVLSCHYGPNGLVGVLLKKGLPRLKVVVTFHGYDVQLGFERGKDFYRPLFTQADLILVNSEFTRRRLLEQGADASRLRVHYMGVETEKFPYRGGRPVRQDGVFRILTVCRLCGQKGLDTSLRAVRELINMIPSVPIEYRIVGDGPDREMLEKLTEELGLKEYVVFAGPMEQSGVVEQMRQADVFLLTSVYEWLGVVLLEAQAIGLPIVATNVGGIPEAVSAGESAILVPPSNPRAAAEALAECLRHPEKREKMGLAGRKHVEEHFDIDRLNDRLEQLFLEISQTVKKNQPVRSASSGPE